MDEKIVQEIIHELFSSFEALDTQSTAILHFLKDKGIANEKDLAPYLEQAGNAASVRWLATRVRIDHLLSSAVKASEGDSKNSQPAKPDALQKQEETGLKQTESKESENNTGATTKVPSAETDEAGNSTSKPGEKQTEAAASESNKKIDTEKAA